MSFPSISLARFKTLGPIILLYLFMSLWYLDRYGGSFMFDFAPHYVVGTIVQKGENHIYDYQFKEQTADYFVLYPGPRYLATAHSIAGFPSLDVPQFSYSPALAPFCALLPLAPVRVYPPLILLVNLACLFFALSFPLFQEQRFGALEWLLFATGAVVLSWGTVVQFNLLAGQSNLVIMALMLAAIALGERGRPLAAGIVLSLPVTMKYFPAVIVLPWLLQGRWRAAVVAASVSLLYLLVGIFMVGAENVSGFLKYTHLLGSSAPSIWFNQSPDAFFLRAFGSFENVWGFRYFHARWWFVLPALVLKVVFFTAGVRLCVGVQRSSLDEWRLAPFYYLMALGTLLLPQAWHHYMPLTLPLSVFLIERLCRGPFPPRMRACGLAAVALILTAIFSPQSWFFRLLKTIEAGVDRTSFFQSLALEFYLRVGLQRFFLGTVALLVLTVILFRYSHSQSSLLNRNIVPDQKAQRSA
ncbi:MAG: hypothetical protein Kow0059_06830 [Candidatus Sumerlaeia bacterium]